MNEKMYRRRLRRQQTFFLILNSEPDKHTHTQNQTQEEKLEIQILIP